jgi:hypothetical protein
VDDDPEVVDEMRIVATELKEGDGDKDDNSIDYLDRQQIHH